MWHMKNILIVIVILMGATRGAAQRQFVAFENVQPEYKTLADVRPVVANRGREPIYLWPQECGEVLVSWLQKDGWWEGDRKPCPRIRKSIKIKPGASYQVAPLVIRTEFGESDFHENRVGKLGKFRISMSYSFRPVYRTGPPRLKESISWEFSIVP